MPTSSKYSGFSSQKQYMRFSLIRPKIKVFVSDNHAKKLGRVGRTFFFFFFARKSYKLYFGDKYPFACCRMKQGLKLED